jgi:hypothetical protein
LNLLPQEVLNVFGQRNGHGRRIPLGGIGEKGKALSFQPSCRALDGLLEAHLEPHVEGEFLGQGRVGLEDGLLEAGQVGQRGGADEAGGERGPVGQVAGDLGRVEQFAGAGKAAGEEDLQVAAGEPGLEAELGGAGQPRLGVQHGQRNCREA